MFLSIEALNQATQEHLAQKGRIAHDMVRSLATLSGLPRETIEPDTDYTRAHYVFDYHPARAKWDQVTTRYPSFTAYKPSPEDMSWVETLRANSVPFSHHYSAIELAAFETTSLTDVMESSRRFVRTRFFRHTADEESYLDPAAYGWSARLSTSGGVGVVSRKLATTTVHNPGWVGHPDWADQPEELAKWQIGALGVSQLVLASIESVHRIPVGAEDDTFAELIADWQKAVPAAAEQDNTRRYSGGVILGPTTPTV